MGLFDFFKKKAKEEATEAFQKIKDAPKDHYVDSAAEALKKVTPDSVDQAIDKAADKITEKI